MSKEEEIYQLQEQIDALAKERDELMGNGKDHTELTGKLCALIDEREKLKA